MRALLVDDQNDALEIESVIFRDLGFDVVTAGNGRLGLEALEKQGPFELCVVDIYMPVLDGHGFVKAMRANPAFKSTRVMMATTETEMAHVSLALKDGADEYLMKPFTREMVRDKLMLMKLLAHDS